MEKKIIDIAQLKKNMIVLDLACGTCDLSILILNKIKNNKNLFMLDINYKMLKVGLDKCINNNIINPNLIQCDAQFLPFKNNMFDRIFISFGIRNIIDKKLALYEIYRCLNIGGKFFILEFSQSNNYIFNKIYDFYLFKYIPNMGRLISNNFYSYQYLSKSIKKHPNKERLKNIMEKIGFSNVGYEILLNGIIAIHYGYKCY